MQPISLILLFVLLAIVAWFIGQPFVRRSLSSALTDESEIHSLLAERERVLDALQELDFDRLTGKIPPDEYPVLRAALLKKGADILRQLDTLQRGLLSQDSEAEYAARIEIQSAAGPSDDEIEALIAARRVARKVRSGGFCPACGKPVLVSDRYCPSCGKALQS